MHMQQQHKYRVMTNIVAITMLDFKWELNLISIAFELPGKYVFSKTGHWLASDTAVVDAIRLTEPEPLHGLTGDVTIRPSDSG